MTVFDDQKKFMIACGQTQLTPNADQAGMYLTLIDEERAELREAITQQDIVEVADAVIDILVVTIGLGQSFALPMQDLWNEVMRSNFAKINADGTVTRREDGKILKPEGWTPPDLRNVLLKYNHPLLKD